MKVFKFGGTSLADAENILKVKQIVEQDDDCKFIVLSAAAGVTNELTQMLDDALTKEAFEIDPVAKLKERHDKLINELLTGDALDEALQYVEDQCKTLTSYINAIRLLGEVTPKVRAYVLSMGEKLSSYIVSYVIEDAAHVNSLELIITDDNYDLANVDFKKTNQKCRKYLEKSTKKRLVMGGFIGATENGETTILGRGGSDYTAAIVGGAINASAVEIWTDVDGFLTADPRKVKLAYPIPELSFSEAFELASFGAKVLYPPAVKPLFDANISMYIKNTLNPSALGTKITGETCHTASIKGISSIDDIMLFTLTGVGVSATTGILKRLFTVLANASVSVILISQVSSEQSITFAIAPEDYQTAQEAINNNFSYEMSQGVIHLKIEENLSAIAVVGDNMKSLPGVAGRFFGTLGKNGVNVIAIAQGSSEVNISAVVKKADLHKALNVVHEIFFLANRKKINIFLAGIGTVGGRLARQIKKQHQAILENHGVELCLVGVMNSKSMLFDAEGIGFSDLKEKLAADGEPLDVSGFSTRILDYNLRNSVFIDATANSEVASLYEDLLKNYVSVITANKIATSDSYARFVELKKLSSVKGVKFLYETNVGAGLPIIHTLEDLVISGDKVMKIEAVLSGTLNFIFNTLSEDIPLSQTISMARDAGYAEPDPRIDLSGVDVMRKILILARVAGYKLESADVDVEKFLPEICFAAPSIDGFFDEVKKIDADFEALRKDLAARGMKWRFVATFENGVASVNLVEVGMDHPFYNLQGTDNIVTIHTERYNEQPLIIKGAGAGSEVTAMGVFGDLIRFANL